MTNLVKIEGDKYTFFKNKEKVVTVSSESSLNERDLEKYRLNPQLLKFEMEYDYYAPRTFQKTQVEPEKFEAVYFDNTPEALESLEEFIGIDMVNYIQEKYNKYDEFYTVKDSHGKLDFYSIEDFQDKFEEA